MLHLGSLAAEFKLITVPNFLWNYNPFILKWHNIMQYNYYKSFLFYILKPYYFIDVKLWLDPTQRLDILSSILTFLHVYKCPRNVCATHFSYLMSSSIHPKKTKEIIFDGLSKVWTRKKSTLMWNSWFVSL